MSAINTAVILAAGMGLRLQARGRLTPKGFLTLGERPIVEESIELLRAAGIERIVMVTGHLHEFYERLQSQRAGLIETVHNPDFANSGSLYSLCCAADLLDGDFLLLESDLIYEPRAIHECLAFPQQNVVLLSGPTCSGDEIYVATEAGRLVKMSKDPSQVPQFSGEFVGICKISAPLLQAMTAVARVLFEDSGHRNFHYEIDGLVRAAEILPVDCHLVADLVWAEIDDAGHLERARREVYPQLRYVRNRVLSGA